MSSFAKKVEMAANVAIIVVAVLLIAIATRQYLLPKQTPPAQAHARKIPQSGDSVALANVDWRKNGKTLLLAVSTTCHYCTVSGPFYQRLVKEHGNAQLIAVLPQTVGEGQTYMKKLGVEIADVRQVSFNDLRIVGTPTLILIDEGGKVTDVWQGALQPDEENEVSSRLRPEQAHK